MPARAIAVPVLVLAMAACGQTGTGSDAPTMPDDPEPTTSPAASGAPTGDECPGSFPGRELPATGAPDRLVPAEVPTAVLICRYETGLDLALEDAVPLEGQQRLAGLLADVPSDLAVSPLVDEHSSCTANDKQVTPLVVRLSYTGGSTRWVAALSGACPSALTNGAFASTDDGAQDLAASFQAGAWVSTRSRGWCGSAVGRLGQERELVPPGWSTARLCDDDQDGDPGDGDGSAPLGADQARRVVSLLSALPTATDDGDCDPVPGTDRRRHLVVFDYPTGRSVAVRADAACSPSFHNGTLAASGTPAQRRAVLDALGE